MKCCFTSQHHYIRMPHEMMLSYAITIYNLFSCFSSAAAAASEAMPINHEESYLLVKSLTFHELWHLLYLLLAEIQERWLTMKHELENSNKRKQMDDDEGGEGEGHGHGGSSSQVVK